MAKIHPIKLGDLAMAFKVDRHCPQQWRERERNDQGMTWVSVASLLW